MAFKSPRISNPTLEILIVEDERPVARDIQDCLESLGYKASAIVSTGQEAIMQAEALKPDLILMDIMLEGSDIDGVQAAQVIGNRFSVPIIYLTAYADLVTLDRAKQTGPFGYVLKPFREPDLWVAIETAIQRHSLERQLHEKQAWLSGVLNSMGDGVIVFDAAARVQFLNPVAARLTGWRETDALGKPLELVFPVVTNDGARSLLTPAMANVSAGAGLDAFQVDGLLQSRDGEAVAIAYEVTTLLDLDGQLAGRVVVFRDLRPLKARDQAIAESQRLVYQNEALERLNNAKDDFLSTVSHELRTPVSNIKMAARMLGVALNRLNLPKDSPDKNTQACYQYLEILQEEVDRQIALVEDVLVMQQLITSTYLLNFKDYRIIDWLPCILEPLELQAQKKDQKLHYYIGAGLSTIHTDPEVCERVLSELVQNAIKHSPEEAIISIKIWQGRDPTLTPPDRFYLRICNTGVTLSPTEQARIFLPFYRTPKADRWATAGTGLGLALVKELVALLGGTIAVSSSLDQVCFEINLPRDAREAVAKELLP